MRSKEDIIARVKQLKDSLQYFEDARKGSIGYKVAKDALKELKTLDWVIEGD